MATTADPHEIPDIVAGQGAAMQHGQWNRLRRLSRGLAALEQFLAASRLDLAPWLVVFFAAGIAAWFALPGKVWWLGFTGLCSAGAAGAFMAGTRWPGAPYCAMAMTGIFAAMLAGCLTVWARSEIVGTPPVAAPAVASLTGRVLAVEHQSAQERDRLVLAIREGDDGRAMKVRINLPYAYGSPQIVPGVVVRVRARLMPPAAPMLPGAYNFARTAWFSGLAASGSAMGPVEVIGAGAAPATLQVLRNRLSNHILASIGPAQGGIATALITGDEGALTERDVEAMRDAGLAHLLSISGLHVSAVIAAAYFLILRVAALVPWLALRFRLPVAAACGGALVGIGYTLLSGSQVPTVRSCIGALLVLAAMVAGREALSLRMLAIGAFLVLLLWPEALVGPSFQLSFAAVLAIIALSTSAPVRRFTAARDEPWWARGLRNLTMIAVTGLVIECALMPIAFYHFHRSGFYGAMANVIAIPFTTFAVMPLLGLSLAFDLIGLGAPLWWLTGKAIAALLSVAHAVAALPGAVTVMPAFGAGAFILFVAGGLWIGLWRGRIRLLGLPPALGACVLLAMLSPPDILVSGDGRTVGLVDAGYGVAGERQLVMLRQTRSDYTRDNLLELSGMASEPALLAEWPGAQCNRDFCLVHMRREGRTWSALIAKGRETVPERALAAACERVDLVIADRYLPRSCQPRWLKADRRMLDRTGGLAITLSNQHVQTVEEEERGHGWWRTPAPWATQTMPPKRSAIQARERHPPAQRRQTGEN